MLELGLVTLRPPASSVVHLNALNSFRKFSRNVLSIRKGYAVIFFNLPLVVSVIVSVLVKPSLQQTKDGCRKLELVLLRAWHTKEVKRKSGKLQLNCGSLSRF